jgi:L-fuconolactonase
MRIDSHQHYWKPGRGDYYWMNPAVPVLYRDYLPADLRPALSRHDIDKTIVVQAAPTAAETDFLLELAANDDTIGGVIGWLDMEGPQFRQQLDSYRARPKFLGIRPMLQDLQDDQWILRRSVLNALHYVAEVGLPFEFLTYPRHLPFVLQALAAVPRLRAVIDHLSKPEIRTGNLEPWKQWMSQVAEYPNVFCKLSGMITEADHEHWRVEDLRPYVEHVMQCFGPDRVMFGSDWPVCLLAGSYDRVVRAIEEVLSLRRGDALEKKIFGENARSFYKLDAEAGG